MSLPRLDWICMDSSGPMKILCPSMWEAKVTPLLPDLPQRGQGEHLEPAGVRQDGAVPVHELVEPPHLPDDMVARPQVQVVGVAELDLAAHLLQIMGGDAALDGPLCAYVHEHRRLDHAAVGAGRIRRAGRGPRFSAL